MTEDPGDSPQRDERPNAPRRRLGAFASNISQNLSLDWPELWARVPASGISLANKCLLLFGGAVVLIVAMAMIAPWLRMNALVGEGEVELSREKARVWMAAERELPDQVAAVEPGEPVELVGVTGRRLSMGGARTEAIEDPFIDRALRRFDAGGKEIQQSGWDGGARVYRYATVDPGSEGLGPGVLIIERRSEGAGILLVVNTVYLLSSGAMVLGLAVLVFYLITHRIILEPVRELRQTAERVRQGSLDVRSDITTGDEFEELAETFNLMLADMQHSHDQLRTINQALDLKLNELAKTNVALADAAKLKGEFLAKVSHELRTPLNSIIGFAELLLDIARAEADEADRTGVDDPAMRKRKRYLENIDSAGRNLLELIETLLEMAKIEAGKVDLRPEPMVLRDVCEGLLGLIHPLAERKSIACKLEVAGDVPVVSTDVRKFQQIVFNFLSNAVKFIESEDKTGKRGEVILRAEMIRAGGEEGRDRVRVSVIDSGPGIASEDQERIFDTFEQAELGYARGHAGTGLGLPICRELAGYIQAEIQLVSELGRGSMFSLIMPVELDESQIEELKLEQAFRGTLAGRRGWKEGDPDRRKPNENEPQETARS